MPFNPINTQEEFDAAVRAQYGDDIGDLRGLYDTSTQRVTELEGQVTERDQQISTLQGQVDGLNLTILRNRVCHEEGLPFDMADRLRGDKEEDLRSDAQNLRQYVSARRQPPKQQADPEGGAKTKDSQLRDMLAKLKGE